MSEPVIAIVAAEVIPGKESEFEDLTRELFAVVRRKRYGTDRLMRSTKQPNLYYDIREWANAEAAQKAHQDPAIHTLWAQLDQVCKFTHVVSSALEVRL